MMDIERRFPVGTKVTMSKEGVEQFPNYAGCLGEVVGYYKGDIPKVRFEGRKTIDSWHPDFLAAAK